MEGEPGRLIIIPLGRWFGKQRSITIRLSGKPGMTSSQFAEWQAYFSLEPFGEERQELRHGQIMHLLDRAHFSRDEPLRPVDFMNFTERPPEPEMTDEELEAYAARVFGG